MITTPLRVSTETLNDLIISAVATGILVATYIYIQQMSFPRSYLPQILYICL